MKPELKKSILTHLLVIVGFYLITLLLHIPSVFENKSLSQHDILQAEGMSNQLKSYQNNSSEVALWNNYMFSGMPSYFAGLSFPGDLMVYAHLAISAGLASPFNLLFISMVGFYVLLLSFKVRPLIAAAGAIAFALNGFNIISLIAGHNSKIAAVAYMPFVLAGIKLVFDGKRVFGFGLSTIALAMEIRSNHPQITYYLVLIVLVFGLNELIQSIKNKDIKGFAMKTGIIVIASIIAVGANFGRLATTLEYSKYSIRGKSELSSTQTNSSGLDKEYAFRYSNGITEPIFLLVPNFYGGSSQQELSTKSAVAEALKRAGYNRSQLSQQLQAIPTYWGNQPLTAPYFAGTFTVVLFILGIILLPKREKVWLISLAVIGVVLSWGKNFESINYLLFDYLPGYNKFRSVTFTIVITLFSMNLLGFIALDRLFSSQWNAALKKKVLTFLGIIVLLLLGILLVSSGLSYRGAVDSQLPDWLLAAIKSDRKSLLQRDAIRAFMFVISLAVLLWTIFKKNAKLNHVALGFLILLFIDNFTLTKRFLNDEKFTKNPSIEHFAQTNSDTQMINSTQEGDRVLNLQNPFNEARTSYFHESVGGYHGAKIRRYQDLIEYCIQPELQLAFEKLRAQSVDFSDLPVLNMLNTKFMYAGNQAFVNNYSNGSAWVVQKVIPVNNPSEEISTLGGIETKQEAVIDQSKFEIPSIGGSGSIQLISRTPNKLSYTANIANGEALAVFSEIYYPVGWRAYIDGEEVEILRANYILRSLLISEGTHEIVFEFMPKSYSYGNTIMMICSIIVFLIFGFGIYHELKYVTYAASET